MLDTTEDFARDQNNDFCDDGNTGFVSEHVSDENELENSEQSTGDAKDEKPLRRRQIRNGRQDLMSANEAGWDDRFAGPIGLDIPVSSSYFWGSQPHCENK
jgi:hypothetical protein